MSKIILPDLPYDYTALEPHISAETIEFHYGKHHQAYVNNLNNLIAGTPFDGRDLEEIIQLSASDSSNVAVFNNAAQVWNHTFYWNCMSASGGGSPNENLLQRINSDFGSLQQFKDEFKQAAVSQFGSGWAWLVEEGGQLKIAKTGNADLPMAHGQKALLTCDVWEHAYYIDFRNRRPDYVDTFLEALVNWDFVAENLEK